MVTAQTDIYTYCHTLTLCGAFPISDHRVVRLELGRRIRCAALLAVVAVLVRRAAVGAYALDVAVGQEHPAHRVVKLRHRAQRVVAVGVELAVDRLGQRAVAGRVGRLVVVEGDADGGEERENSRLKHSTY